MGRLLILGSGALAREIVLAIPSIAQKYADEEFTVIVAARNADQASWIARLGEARGFAAGVRLKVQSCVLDWGSVDQLAATIAAAAPTAILNAVSLQSAWSLTGANAWTHLVKTGGYGVTAALQAALLPKLARALNSAAVNAKLVNACYPDVINAGGGRMGLNVLCGIGNIALIAELLRQHLSASSNGLQLLAGHWDVNELCRPSAQRSDYPLVWLNGRLLGSESVSGVPPLSGDATMNSFSAGASAALLHALATKRDWTGHAPGPLGELGGYPVCVEEGRIRCDMPAGITLKEARQWNLERCERDGAVVERGERLCFSAKASELIGTFAPDLAGGFDFKDVESAARAFAELRESLSKRPAEER
jgi:NAD(P)-dependent dehydrogenase (short-subunit alcohol dehydrogenase family)